MKFRVCEVVWYEVEAETCKDAIEVIVQSEDLDELFVECEDRYAVPLDSEGNATGEACDCPECQDDSCPECARSFGPHYQGECKH